MRYAQIVDEFRRAPFVRFTLPFLLGIAWQIQILPIHTRVWFIAAALLALYICMQITIKSYILRWTHGVVLSLLLFACGIAAAQNVRQQTSIPQSIPLKLLGVVAEPPTSSAKSNKYTLNVKAWQDSLGRTNPVDEKIFLYLPLQDAAAMPQSGDELIVSAILKPIPPPLNPHEFDYATYARRRQIFSTAYVYASHYAITASNQLNWFAALCQKMRHNSIKILENTGIEGEELAALLTITLGDRSRLDANLRNAYTAAGAAHVLSVSGAHVMMVAMILGWFFLPMNRRRYGRIVSGCAIVLILWLYALITGMNMPVARAALMFSLLTIGNMLAHKTNAYNNLAIAAAIICLLDPNALYNIGFQLSFMAVLSIVFFFPRIFNLINVKTKPLTALWSAISVAIAANIGIFPLIIFVYHQFPLYFIATAALIALPLAFTLISFVVIFIMSLLPLVHILVPIAALLLRGNLFLINTIVHTIEKTPHSTIDGLWLTAPQMWTMLLAILLIALWRWGKQRRHMWRAMGGFAVTIAIYTRTLYQRQQRHFPFVHSIKNDALITRIIPMRAIAICPNKCNA
jgi:competence protein ComEC